MNLIKIKRLDGWHSEFSIEGKLLCHKSTSWRGTLREYWPIEWTATSVVRRQSAMTVSRGIFLIILLGAVLTFAGSIMALVNSSSGPIWKAPGDHLISIGVLCAALAATSWGLVHFGGQWMGGAKLLALIIHPPFSAMIAYELPAPKSEDDSMNLLAERIAWHRSQPTDLTYNDNITPFQMYQPSSLDILRFRLIRSSLVAILLLIITAVFVNVAEPTASDIGIAHIRPYQLWLYPLIALLPFLTHVKDATMLYFKQKKRPLALRQAEKRMRQADAEGAVAILDDFADRDSLQDALEMSVIAAVMAGNMPAALKHCAKLQAMVPEVGENALAYVQQFRTLFARREQQQNST